jgi:hypothetical protein
MSRLLIALSLAFAAAACGGSNPERCSMFGAPCPGGGTVKNCCFADFSSCRLLTSDGTEFDCNLSDCSQAAMLASAWCQAH